MSFALHFGDLDGILVTNHEMMSGEAVKVFSGEGEVGDGEVGVVK
jgi:hypothetical protein